MRRECRERFPRHQLQRKPLVSDLGIHHDTCVTHVPWCMSGSLTRGGEENILGIPGACAARDFTYLVRGPLHYVSAEVRNLCLRRLRLICLPMLLPCLVISFFFFFPEHISSSGSIHTAVMIGVILAPLMTFSVLAAWPWTHCDVTWTSEITTNFKGGFRIPLRKLLPIRRIWNISYLKFMHYDK